MSDASVEIGVVMSSEQDLLVMKEAVALIASFGVNYELDILDPHRDPDKVINYARNAQSRGLKAIIASGSGAVHLPGLVASLTAIPVIGVPIRIDKSLDGIDSIYSILQMPEGVPVGTMALNGARNAALFAIQILSMSHGSYYDLVMGYKNKLKGDSESKAKKLMQQGYEASYERLLEQSK